MKRRGMIIPHWLPVLLLWLLGSQAKIYAQTQTQTQASEGAEYLLVPVPDVWYNQVDGFRLGIRIKGQQPLSFNDGPHRLSMGVWVATKWPDLPVSYHIAFTEPISSWSSFASEASVTALSSVREGYAIHGLIGRKRWQQGFNESQFTLLETKLTADNRFDLDYPLYPKAWQRGWQYTAASTLESHRTWQGVGRFTHHVSFLVGFSEDHPDKAYTQLELSQEGYHGWSSTFGLAHRLFLGLGTESLPLQHRYHPASGKAMKEVESGFTRSAGLLPSSAIEHGYVHLAGGPNLRAYTQRNDADSSGFFSLRHRMLAANLELKFPNPLSKLIQQIPLMGSVLQSRMYLFSDVGKPLEANTKMMSNAGLGFALGLTIPDMTGQTNAITFRIDVPAWISHPAAAESKWKFRPVFGLNSVIAW